MQVFSACTMWSLRSPFYKLLKNSGSPALRRTLFSLLEFPQKPRSSLRLSCSPPACGPQVFPLMSRSRRSVCFGSRVQLSRVALRFFSLFFAFFFFEGQFQGNGKAVSKWIGPFCQSETKKRGYCRWRCVEPTTDTQDLRFMLFESANRLWQRQTCSGSLYVWDKVSPLKACEPGETLPQHKVDKRWLNIFGHDWEQETKRSPETDSWKCKTGESSPS